MRTITLCFRFIGSGHVIYSVVPSDYRQLTMDASGCTTLLLTPGFHTLFFTLNTGGGGTMEATDEDGQLIASDDFPAGYYSNAIYINL